MNTELLRRAIEEALNRSGMTAGLPKVTVDASQLNSLLLHYEQVQFERDKLWLAVQQAAEYLDSARRETHGAIATIKRHRGEE